MAGLGLEVPVARHGQLRPVWEKEVGVLPGWALPVLGKFHVAWLGVVGSSGLVALPGLAWPVWEKPQLIRCPAGYGQFRSLNELATIRSKFEQWPFCRPLVNFPWLPTHDAIHPLVLHSMEVEINRFWPKTKYWVDHPLFGALNTAITAAAIDRNNHVFSEWNSFWFSMKASLLYCCLKVLVYFLAH